MHKSTILSFVLPLRNEIKRVEETVESLLGQDTPCELIIVDDHSTDGTWELLCDKYHKQATIIRNTEHMGGAYSRNIGNKMATTPYIGVCDSDLYYSDRARILIKEIHSKPDVDVFYTSAEFKKEGSEIFTLIAERIEDFFERAGGRTIKMPIRHQTVCYKRGVVVKHPYPEESKETDSFEKFFMTLMKHGYKFDIIRKSTALVYRGTTNRDKQACEELRKKHYAEFGLCYSR
jgi:glycosyltransferase involved in cell wall biosynthesis